MSDDEFEDDGVTKRRKKPPRLRIDGKPDGRCPPVEHRFKRGEPSRNPDGARKHRTRRRSRKGRLTLDELLATEIILPTGETMTYGEIIDLKQIKAASEGSTAAYKAIQDARAKSRAGAPEPEPEAVVQKKRRLAAQLTELVVQAAHLKKLGLSGPGECGLAPWIHEEHRRRIDEGLLPPTSTYLWNQKRPSLADIEAADAADAAEAEGGAKKGLS